MTDLEGVRYELCGHACCYHFIEQNSTAGERAVDPALAAYVHLDDGDKEHDHDAEPSGAILELRDWRKIAPYLFTLYDDDKIGPNSEHFTAPLATSPEPSDTGSGPKYLELLGRLLGEL